MADENDVEPEGEESSEKVPLSEKMAAYKPWFQVGGLVFLLLMLMTTSVVTGLMVTGVININEENRRAVSNIADAMSICDTAIQEEHSELLQAFVVDDRSSHGDERSGGYRLYYEMSMYRDSSRTTGVKKFYINCFVSANGRIKRMDLMEDKSFVPRAVRQSKGNAIGL